MSCVQESLHGLPATLAPFGRGLRPLEYFDAGGPTLFVAASDIGDRWLVLRTRTQYESIEFLVAATNDAFVEGLRGRRVKVRDAFLCNPEGVCWRVNVPLEGSASVWLDPRVPDDAFPKELPQ